MFKRIAILIFLFIASGVVLSFGEEEQSKDPANENVIVNGDNVEYSADSKEFSAVGNVEINYSDTRLFADKLKINTQTKDVQAEGGVRLENKEGIIEGSDMVYNFQDKAGIINNAQFRFAPFFGRAEQIKKISDNQLTGKRGYMTTCDYEKPHYRMKYRKMNFYPGEKMELKDARFMVGNIPALYLPHFARSLKDPFMHVQFSPGKSKDWGYYMLTAWRFNPSENISWRVYLDYRDYMGIAQGLGTNYKTEGFGKGDFKFYYMQERNKSKVFSKLPVDAPKVFQRYFVRLRHKWEVDERTNFIGEYYKIVDSKRVVYSPDYLITKDFFPREYEKDAQPLSYISAHRSFNYSMLDLVMQPRTNRWYDETEKLPEVKYSLPSLQVFQLPNHLVYFENNSQLVNYNHKYPVPNDKELDMVRFDTSNKVSFSSKLAFINFNPYVMNRATYYNKDVDGASIAPRIAFYTGADLSTKFYRIFNVQTNAFGLNLNGLRHVITPTVGYSYNHMPTLSNTRLKQMDGIDSISRNHSMTLQLSNKLQTKQAGGKGMQSLDLVNFLLTTNYYFQPGAGTDIKRGSGFSDLQFLLEIIPYSWMRIYSDATFVHTAPRDQVNYRKFSVVNYDVNFSLAKNRSFGFGQRYVRKGQNELVYNLRWQLNPKWYVSMLHRKELGNGLFSKRGLKLEQYTFTRDMHCWTMNLTYEVIRSRGETVWLTFRLKAFPELEFEYNREYYVPKPGSQSPDQLQ